MSSPNSRLPTSETPLRRIAVLGGGITGLAATYSLARARQNGAHIEEILIEASDRLGGVLRTEQVNGFVVEGGPDSFLSEKPEAAALCRELGLGDLLLGSNDAQRRTYVLHHGRLVPLPDGLLLFIPTRFAPVLASPLLPLSSKLAVLAGWAGWSRGRRGQAADESVADFIRRHFGRAMLENIADPLLAGVFGGDSNLLSARSVLPRFWEMDQKDGNLIRALRLAASRRPAVEGSKTVPAAARPIFTTLKGGLGQMVKALEKQLAGSRVLLGQRVRAIGPAPGSPDGAAHSPGSQYRIESEGGVSQEVDALVLALPARECGRLLSTVDPILAESLQAIPYAPALTVALAYDLPATADLPPGFGFLVPQKEKRRLLACTFVHGKFNHRAPPGKALLRCFLGGWRDREVMGLGDDEIVSIARQELRVILSLSAEPLFYRIHRWPASMPQYAVGHSELMAKIDKRLEAHPGLFLAGNAYSGIGMSDCIRTGKTAAERALKVLLPQG